MEMVNITIDTRKIQVPKHYTVLEAAKYANIEIPTLCYLRDINEIGACRMCVVEIKGARRPSGSMCVSGIGRTGDIHTDSKGKGIKEGNTGAHPFEPREEMPYLCQEQELRAAEAGRRPQH